jgi:hypothetical protein
MLRAALVISACVLGAASAVAEELGPEQAKAFVVNKLFAYTCFDGTAGMGRIFEDGSVVGTIRPGGKGEVRFASLPPGTIRIEGGSMCAHLSGMPLQPCFKVQKIDFRSFRGSVSGLGFAYCDFYQNNPRAQIISRLPEQRNQFARRSLASRGQNAGRAAAPAQTSPVEPVEAMAITPVQETPPAPAQAAPVAPPAPVAPAAAAPAAPADRAPTATLRPAIAD